VEAPAITVMHPQVLQIPCGSDVANTFAVRDRPPGTETYQLLQRKSARYNPRHGAMSAVEPRLQRLQPHWRKRLWRGAIVVAPLGVDVWWAMNPCMVSMRGEAGRSARGVDARRSR
jgi:hypothetical protein